METSRETITHRLLFPPVFRWTVIALISALGLFFLILALTSDVTHSGIIGRIVPAILSFGFFFIAAHAIRRGMNRAIHLTQDSLILDDPGDNRIYMLSEIQEVWINPRLPNRPICFRDKNNGAHSIPNLFPSQSSKDEFFSEMEQRRKSIQANTLN